ncbi:helix-turn-helix domain-containing protein [Neobacillus sp. FSL H8-0543]|uniref:TetR/AcrR family transcriptional regulator n=1 Tax=Neobacillus sp. FSL H8-0543 TaxID=2954672 RepID=UPI003158F30E
MRTATKNKIHTASIKLFAKKGFAATSVQDIADTAGISTRLLYPHYKTNMICLMKLFHMPQQD